MKTKNLLALLLVSMFALTACYRHVYNVGDGAPSGAIVYADAWYDHWFFGLANTEDPIDIKKYCPSGNATIVEERTFINSLVSVVALGGLIYSPTAVTIKCDKMVSVQILIDINQAKAIAADSRFLPYVARTAPDSLSVAVLAHRSALSR